MKVFKDLTDDTPVNDLDEEEGNDPFSIFYDFCLDWQMDEIPKETLKQQFKDYNWKLDEFKHNAKACNYWVSSMEELKN